MADYSTEEQQAEALRDFWKSNGKTIMFGIFVGIIGILGWQYFQKFRAEKMEESTAQYMSVVEKMKTGYNKNTVDAAEALIEANKGKVYSDMASLNLAALAVEQEKDFALAEKNLRIAAESRDVAVASVAKLRLARVLIQMNRYDEAEKTLASVKEKVYQPSALEIRGDMLLSQGKNDEAKKVYAEALELVKGTQSERLYTVLKIKLDDLN